MAQQRMNVQAPIERLFAERWSTRAFDAKKPVKAEALVSCLEAARWAPSCFGEEPWQYIVADRFDDEAGWRNVLRSLATTNQVWAEHAPVLIVAFANPEFSHNGNPNRWAEYDTGQATICLCLQASALGLASHQMGGFDPQTLKKVLKTPKQMVAMSVIALGYPGEANRVAEDFRPVEIMPRTRKPIEETAHAGYWERSIHVPLAAGWEARYQETPVEQLPWFHAALDADFEQVLDLMETTERNILDIGCGPGTQAVALARRGFSVTAGDVSGSAVEAARKLANAEKVIVHFLVDDVLDSRLSGPFDLILDRGVFHCFADNVDRKAYLATVRRLLKPDGVLLLKCFHKDEQREEGPPGRYDEADINCFFDDGFELIEAHESFFNPAVSDESPKALFCKIRRIRE
ncbi:MAG: nitroreductase family protein [Mariprofundaceae bacterium]